MRLHSVVLTVGRPELEATVVDRLGHRRRIRYTWAAREVTHIPPPSWLEAIAGEVEFCIADEAAERDGRKFEP